MKVLEFGKWITGIILTLWVTSCIAAEQSNWPAWRGVRDDGRADSETCPVFLDPTNALWKADLPGKACSTPVIWGKRIFLTAPTNHLDSVLAFNWGGHLEWLTTFGTETPGAHRNGSGSNPSAVTDGNSLFVRFKSGTLACLDLQGKIRWQTNLIRGFGPENLYWDQGTSPVLSKNDVIIARMHGGESWLSAFDKMSGHLRWQVARNFVTPVEGDHAYSTPIIIRGKSSEEILVWGAQHLTDHDAKDGSVLWTCGGFNPEAVANWPSVASPVLAGRIAVIACGRADRGQPRLYGIKLGGSGDVTSTHLAWKRQDVGTFVPTPAVSGDKVYVLRDRGELECLDPQTGATVWKNAFPKSSHNFYASPLICGERLYAAREDGVIFVARIGSGFEFLSESKLAEQVIASPVAVANRLFIRGEHHLFCFADAQHSKG
jgi:outer membrane protein assembly factor BamB